MTSPPAPAAEPAVKAGQVRLMTWNVQHANAERSRRQAAWIADQPIDVAVLTEVAATRRHHALAESLTEHGFTICGTAGSGTDYQTIIASRTGRVEACPQIRASHLPHRCAAARLHISADLAVGIVGLYVPSRGSPARRNEDKRAFQKAVTVLLPGLQEAFGATSPVIIAGDLNVIEPGHQPAHAVFGGWEYAFYRSFGEAGYADAYRHLHPDQIEHSWHGRRSGAGYRFDHIFTSDSQTITDCYYDHHPRQVQLSDHSAMTLRVVLGSTALVL